MCGEITMTNNTPSLDTLFCKAIEIADPVARADFMKRSCGSNVELYQRVDALVAAHFKAGRFLDQPTDATAAHVPADGNRRPHTSAPAVGSIIGPYKLREILGEGGMGTVFVAEQEKPVRRKVALKIIKLGMDSREVISRFEAERQALALMDHSNIAKVLDAGTTEGGRPYFVMELVKGIPITAHCDAHKLETRERLDLFLQVCQAVQHAHQKGIIHRDLKPSNILVAMNDATPVIKVIDFGVAKAIGQQLTDHTIYTAFSQMVGTPLYMSPEQAGASNVDIDTRSDIYSLGVLLYEVLTGYTPFDSAALKQAGLDEMRRIIREVDPPRPSARISTLNAKHLTTVAQRRQMEPRKLSQQLRGELDCIVMMALEKDRNRRYETANAFARDVQRYLSSEPVEARPTSAGYRLQKLIQRNKGPVIAAGLVLVSLLAGIMGTTLGLFRASKAETESNQRLIESRRATAEAAALAKERGELLERNEAQGKSLRSSSGKIALQYGISIYDSPLRHDGAKELMRAALLVKDDATKAEPYSAFILNRLTEGGRSFSAPLKAGETSSLAFSPDGQRIATASGDHIDRDHNARIWDLETGQPVGEPLSHSSGVRAVAFSPDGRHLATASNDKTARLWDWKTGQPVGVPMIHSGEVADIAFSPDGRRVATASNDKTARIWDAVTGLPVGEPLKHLAGVYGLDFSPDGLNIATASLDSTARIWNVETGNPISAPLKNPSGVMNVSFSPDGGRIVTTCGDMTAWIWDAVTGQPVNEPLKHGAIMRDFATRGGLTCISLSPDGRHIAAACADATVRVWDLETGRPVGELLKHAIHVQDIAFSPDGARIATWSLDGLRLERKGGTGIVQIWDLETGQPDSELLKHADLVLDVAFSPDGRRVATASIDKTARIWDAETGKSVGEPLRHSGMVTMVTFSPDGRRVVSASGETGQIWDAETGLPVGKPLNHAVVVDGKRLDQADVVDCIVFSPDGRRVATGSWDKTARIWDAETGNPMGEPLIHSSWVQTVAFSPDGRHIATACHDASARIWDVETGQPVGEPMKHSEIVRWVAFSPDGRRVATVCDDRAARIWDAESCQPVCEPMKHAGRVMNFVFSPDGRTVATASEDSSAQIWDAHTGLPIGDRMKHASLVYRIVFSPDGRRVATASSDRTARIWDAGTGLPVSEPLKHAGEVRDVAFSPDGRSIVTACADANARIWDVSEFPMPTEKIAWMEVLAGYSIDDDIEPIRLTDAETAKGWATLKQDQQWIKAIKQFRDERSTRWSRYMLREAESDHHWFAAAFYLRQFLKSDPENTNLKSRLAVAEKYLPHWRTDFDSKQAEKKQDWPSAIPLIEDLAKHFPTDASIIVRKWYCEQHQKIPSDAEKAFESLESIFELGSDSAYALATVRIRGLLLISKNVDAIATATRFVEWAEKLKVDTDTQRYNAAVLFAICACEGEPAKDNLIDQAIGLLEKIKSNGYFDSKRIAHLKKVTDFDGIRQHAKFKEFLDSLDLL